SRDPAAFVRAMEGDLAHATLFVQLLGEDCSLRTEELPHGYEGLQLEHARALGRPLLRWRRRELEVERVRDVRHRQFLQDVDVMSMDLEEFKTEIVRELRRRAGRLDRPQPDTAPFVLITARPPDLPVADELGSHLQQWHMDFDILAEDLALPEVLGAETYDAVMVVYGGCPQEWVQHRVRVLRQVALDTKAKAPRCAVYVGPPPLDQKDPLRCRFRSLQLLDRDTLGAFLQTLR